MFSEPIRRAAMIEAERTARPIASDKVVLAQEGVNEEPGFLIYMPVFESSPMGRTLKGLYLQSVQCAELPRLRARTGGGGRLRRAAL